MKELKKTYRLTLAVVVVLIIMVVGFVSIKRSNLNYVLPPEALIEEFYNLDNEMIPEEAADIVAYEDSTFVFLDIRNQYEFDRGHIENAINIPSASLLAKSSLKYFQKLEGDSISIVLYANTQLEVVGAWMLMKQLGFQNLKMLLGGYSYYANNELDFYNMPQTPEYLPDIPTLNYAEFMEEIGSRPLISEEQKEPSNPIELKPRKKKTITEGGC